MTKRYSTILADPPWLERGGGKIKRGADRHYPLLKTEQIAAMPVSSFADDNSHLYLWITNNHLPDGLRVMEAWGFKYKTMITWAKDRMGIGQYFRGMTEHVLFGVRGNIPYRFRQDGKRAQGRTLITAPKGAHSEKPEELRSMVQVVSPGPYLELFAREKYPGWDAWGNEVESDITMPGLWSMTEKFKLSRVCPDCNCADPQTCSCRCHPEEPARQCFHSHLTEREEGRFSCDDCGEASVKPEKCGGCDRPATRYAFCKSCYAEYKEDPDAFK